MEAVTAIIKNLLKNTRIVLVLGVVLGLILGLILGWGIWPVTYTSTTPELLEQTIQDDYLRMAIDSYRSNKGVNQQVAADIAEDRWEYLGNAAGPALGRVQADPRYLDPISIQDFRALIESRKGAIASTPPAEESSGLSSIVLYASIAVVGILLGAGGVYLYRLLRKNSGPVTAVMQASEVSRQAEKTNFEEMGLAPPITQTMTTYVLGDDLYDESFSIDTGGGEFLGE